MERFRSSLQVRESAVEVNLVELTTVAAGVIAETIGPDGDFIEGLLLFLLAVLAALVLFAMVVALTCVLAFFAGRSSRRAAMWLIVVAAPQAGLFWIEWAVGLFFVVLYGVIFLAGRLWLKRSSANAPGLIPIGAPKAR
jgi:hypothetical protein